jgi:hypothetical protein
VSDDHATSAACPWRFTGTDALFSIYVPPKEQYRDGFFQPVPAMSGENTAQPPPGEAPNINITQENTTIGLAVASSAYLVESN